MTEHGQASPETSDPVVALPAAVDSQIAKAEEEVKKNLLLGTYVDQVAPPIFTEEAKATLLLEIKQYAQDVISLSRMRRRADRNAEKVLRSHVVDSANFLRVKKTSAINSIADWSKWIGFTFVGFAVQQWIHITGEKPIASGSVGLLVLDVIIATILIIAGFMIDKPWGYFTDRFRRG